MNTMLNIFLLIGGLGTTELIIILVIVLLLFGGRKIPQLAKDIGLGIKEFKKGISGIDESSHTEMSHHNQLENQSINKAQSAPEKKTEKSKSKKKS